MPGLSGTGSGVEATREGVARYRFLLSVARLPARGPWLCAPASRRVCLCRGRDQMIHRRAAPGQRVSSPHPPEERVDDPRTSPWRGRPRFAKGVSKMGRMGHAPVPHGRVWCNRCYNGEGAADWERTRCGARRTFGMGPGHTPGPFFLPLFARARGMGLLQTSTHGGLGGPLGPSDRGRAAFGTIPPAAPFSPVTTGAAFSRSAPPQPPKPHPGEPPEPVRHGVFLCTGRDGA